VQTDTYLACLLLSQTLRHMVNTLVRDYLVELLETGIDHWVITGYYPQLTLAEPGGELQAARPSADGVRLDWSAIGGLAAQDASDPFAVGQFAKAPGRAFRRSSASDATKMSRPATASTAPTHPVEAHPNPAPMATPPNHAPIALAMLKAE